MHLLTILAFAVLLWEGDDPRVWTLTPLDDIWVTLAAVLAGPLLITATGRWLTYLGRARLRANRRKAAAVHEWQHRWMFILRVVTVAWFAGLVFLTNWYGWFSYGRVHPALQIVGDLIALQPYLLTAVLLWTVSFPLDQALRDSEATVAPDDESGLHWRFRSYMLFHIRHYILVIAVPMTVILFAADVIRGYEASIQQLFGAAFAPDLLLGAVAAGVFVTAPVMLRYIWHTEPLPPGPLRDRLEALGKRIGLRFHDVLIWRSDGMMINAAVMGVLPRFRYVLLSDALLDAMSDRQVEAVFGHEAGHVCRRHIPLFLVFAFVGWLVTVALMEGLAHAAIGLEMDSAWVLTTIQMIGIGSTVAFWGIGFGALSRRFERQADLFGARCVATQEPCQVPCSVHFDDGTSSGDDDRVCATGAAVFSTALDRVALLNGIPHEEWSWRHASIGSRMRFLAASASDPALTGGFERRLRRIARVMVVVAGVGLMAGLLYWHYVPVPAILRLQGGEVRGVVVSDR